MARKIADLRGGYRMTVDPTLDERISSIEGS
jgi:hypothetical protein